MRSHAWQIASATVSSSRPILRFASAHAFFTWAKAMISSRWIGWPRMRKFLDARSV